MKKKTAETMKQRIQTIFYTLATAVVLAACGDKLNVDPRNSIDESTAVSTSSDVEALLVGAYNALSDIDVYGGAILRDAELMGDDGEIFWDGTFTAPGEIFAKTMLITNGQAENTWLDSYKVINICNLVLANLEVVTPDKIKRIEGEAKFLRGTVYFELARTFGKTWVDGNPAQNPAVPLVVTPTTAENADDRVERSSVEAVYNQAISDLTDAQKLLPRTNGFFATKYAASAILSRIYLMQQNFGAAAASADSVIKSERYTLTKNYADAFNATSSSGRNATSEDIFAIQITSQDGTNDLNTFFASSDFGGRGDIYIESKHFALYEDGDTRAELFNDDWTAKFNNVFGNITIVRLAEMYLTRAEANFRNNQSLGATPVADINTIRTRAGLDPVTTVTLDQILQERHIELAFEGHRIHDLKRTRTSVGSIPYNSPRLVFPVPQRELNIYNIGQNEGYTGN